MRKSAGVEGLNSLHRGAAASDGVIHLAFNHGLSDFAAALTADLRAVETMGAALPLKRQTRTSAVSAAPWWRVTSRGRARGPRTSCAHKNA